VDFETIAANIVELLNRKTTDYGNSYDRLREEFGDVAFYIRLFDKLYRLMQVDKHGHQVEETAQDTLKDIVGYCLLELRYRKGEEGQP
jgi:hypothetical protein